MKYRYAHKDVPTKSGVGTWTAGTTICAKKSVIMEMLVAYRRMKGIKPLQSLSEKGIFVDNRNDIWRIVVSHPRIMASYEEVRTFPHREIAADITAAWRMTV